jgi:hypothetical protein
MLQLIYAAPFLFAAGALFIALSSFSTTRRYAITVPAGIVAFGPGSLIVYFFSALVGDKVFGHQGPATWLNGIAYVLGGLASSYIFAKFVASIGPMLPNIPFRLAVAGSAFCSYVVVLSAVHIVLNINFHYAKPSTFAIGLYIAIFLVGLWAAWHWFTVAETSTLLPHQRTALASHSNLPLA